MRNKKRREKVRGTRTLKMCLFFLTDAPWINVTGDVVSMLDINQEAQ